MHVTGVFDLGVGVDDQGDARYDRLAVAAVDDAGEAIETVLGPDGALYAALGWVSATTNHYDAAAYSTDDDGKLHRDGNAQPRAMTAAEVGAYAEQLLADQNPPAPTPIAFTAAGS